MTDKRYITVKYAIDYWLNEGTRCASNTIEELKRINTRCDAIGAVNGGQQPCLCMVSRHDYLRESTAEDLDRCGIRSKQWDEPEIETCIQCGMPFTVPRACDGGCEND